MKFAIGLAVLASLVLVGSGATGVPTRPVPSRFVPRVDNPWFPLVPGATFVYRGVEDGESTREVVHVTTRTRVIDGVRCTAVSDRLYSGGHLAERTTDWYAQDARGTVWYFGEATAELDDAAKVTTREGSWLAGVHGARAGVLMPAHPRVGQELQQEYLQGHAEDRFRVLDTGAAVRVPVVSSRHGLLTREWSPLEPGVVDHKLYVRGIGLVSERTVRGGDEHAVLVRWSR
jgi:hypothetical protein